jgi:hypothetical protein
MFGSEDSCPMWVIDQFLKIGREFEWRRSASFFQVNAPSKTLKYQCCWNGPSGKTGDWWGSYVRGLLGRWRNWLLIDNQKSVSDINIWIIFTEEQAMEGSFVLKWTQPGSLSWYNPTQVMSNCYGKLDITRMFPKPLIHKLTALDIIEHIQTKWRLHLHR